MDGNDDVAATDDSQSIVLSPLNLDNSSNLHKIYRPDPPVVGYSSVHVNVDTRPAPTDPSNLGTFHTVIDSNGPYVFDVSSVAPDLDGWNRLEIGVNVQDTTPEVKLTTLDTNITTNGTTILNPAETSPGYGGYSGVTIRTNVLPKLQELVKTISQNRVYNFIPDPGYDGFSAVAITGSFPTPPELVDYSLTLNSLDQPQSYTPPANTAWKSLTIYTNPILSKITTIQYSVTTNNTNISLLPSNYNNSLYFSKVDLSVIIPVPSQPVIEDGTLTLHSFSQGQRFTPSPPVDAWSSVVLNFDISSPLEVSGVSLHGFDFHSYYRTFSLSSFTLLTPVLEYDTFTFKVQNYHAILVFIPGSFDGGDSITHFSFYGYYSPGKSHEYEISYVNDSDNLYHRRLIYLDVDLSSGSVSPGDFVYFSLLFNGSFIPVSLVPLSGFLYADSSTDDVLYDSKAAYLTRSYKFPSSWYS